jgi:ATP-dependent Clp protease ATP-binding subunit ClpX
MFDLPGSDESILIVDKKYAENKINKSTIKKLKAVG